MFLSVYVLSALCVCAHSAGLLDEPVVADTLQYLDGAAWILTNNGSTTIESRVPGDIITDMQRAGVIDDPLYERNFKSTIWDATDWSVYAGVVPSSAVLSAPTRLLVFDGIKMGSYIWFNGHFLGQTADQFLRYTFDVSSLLVAGTNAINITFPPSANAINDESRWMACSGACAC